MTGYPPQFISNTARDILEPFAVFAFLMGSAETERFHAESDVDIGVYWRADVTREQQINCLNDLVEKFDRDVQLISLNEIDVIFARQVLETGRLLINHSPGILLNWKVNMMSNYPDFKTSRKIIEENILNRKKYV